MPILNIVIKILALVCAFSMFVLPRSYKVGIMMMSYLLFSLVFFPGVSAMTLTAICFFLSEIVQYRKWFIYLKRDYSIRWYLWSSLLLILLTCIISPHLHQTKDVLKFLIDEGIGKFALFFVGLFAVTKKENLIDSYKVIFFSMIIVSVFALINILFRYSPYVEALFPTTTGMYDFNSSSRFRVQATFLNPFDYGFSCILYILLSGYLFIKKNIDVSIFIVALCCGFLGILSCGCRTIFAVLIITTFLAVLITYKSKTLRFVLIVMMIAVIGISYVVSPSVRKMVDMSVTMFDLDASVDGSSIEGRRIQTAAVFMEIKDNPLLGKGYNYFTKDIGWSEDGTAASSNRDLLGLEGVYMNYLLERGIVGFLLYLITICAIFWMFVYDNKDRPLKAFGISIFSAYFLYAFMTGELLSYQPTMLVEGCLYAMVFRRRYINHKLATRNK